MRKKTALAQFPGLAVAASLCAAAFFHAPGDCAAADAAAREPEAITRHVDRIATLDPVHAQSVASARCVSLIYETLLEYEYLERPYKLRGCVAEGMPDISPDGLSLTFRIREGVFFGPDDCFGEAKRRELTADDVVYSLKRIADAKITSGAYWMLSGKVAGIEEFHERSLEPTPTDYGMEVSGLSAPDNRTLVIRLSRPCPQFTWILAMPPTAIVPREAVEKYGADFGLHDAGSGPFMLRKWRRNYSMDFVRRPGRDIARDATPLLPDAAGCAPVDEVRFRVMDDPSTRWLAILSGLFDLEGEIPRENWSNAITPDGALAKDVAAKGLRMESQPSMDCYFIGLNCDDPALGNKKLRQALNAAFNFDEWASFSPGRMAQATGPVPGNVAGRIDTPFAYSFNLDNARRLIAEAGYPGGKDGATGRRLTLKLSVGRTDREMRETSELLASFLEKIGVNLELEFSNWPAFLKRVSQREAQAFRISWIADYPDAENFLQLFYSKNASPGPNRANYSNPEFDKLFEAAINETGEQERLDLYRRMQEIVREDCPWIFLHHRRDSILIRDRVRNFKMHDFPYGFEKHYRILPRP